MPEGDPLRFHFERRQILVLVNIFCYMFGIPKDTFKRGKESSAKVQKQRDIDNYQRKNRFNQRIVSHRKTQTV